LVIVRFWILSQHLPWYIHTLSILHPYTIYTPSIHHPYTIYAVSIHQKPRFYGLSMSWECRSATQIQAPDRGTMWKNRQKDALYTLYTPSMYASSILQLYFIYALGMPGEQRIKQIFEINPIYLISFHFHLGSTV
jgi:hypothetical protein